MFAKPLSGCLGKGLMVWTHEQIAKLKAHTHTVNAYRGSWVQQSTVKHEKIAAIRLG